MAALVVGSREGAWRVGIRSRAGGGSPDDARWDARKKERTAEEGVRSPDLRKKRVASAAARRMMTGGTSGRGPEVRRTMPGGTSRRRGEEWRWVAEAGPGEVEEEVKRGKWCAGMRVPWVEAGALPIYSMIFHFSPPFQSARSDNWLREGSIAQMLFNLILEDMRSGPPSVRIPVSY
uniref:Uncharacterized protein n=1 Tax=Oryza meridionalis TaxID=40149 RepID=A0A0E0CIZ8_9ORYZ